MMGNAVIIGATGLVGGECLRLIATRYDSVTAVVRRAVDFTHPHVREQRIDFDRLDTIDVPRGAHVYCALGSTIKKAGSQEAFRRIDHDYPLMLARRAAEAGEARFAVVSSVGASATSANFYLRVKGELEDALRRLPFAALHIFRPSFLMGNRAERRPGERVALAMAPALGILLQGPLRKYRAIPAAGVARAMVTAVNRDVSGTFIYHYDEIRRLME
jgi:uncharacterized protein YbjT (DUF2867 family)